MKVIIIKDCKQGKINEIIEVSNGYGKNFLIPKKFAVPYNQKTVAILNKNILVTQGQKEAALVNVIRVKDALEKLILSFDVKFNNGVFHNSISKKQIVQELRKNKIRIDSYSIENFKINSLGLINVKINLAKNVIAMLKLKVKDGN